MTAEKNNFKFAGEIGKFYENIGNKYKAKHYYIIAIANDDTMTMKNYSRFCYLEHDVANAARYLKKAHDLNDKNATKYLVYFFGESHDYDEMLKYLLLVDPLVYDKHFLDYILNKLNNQATMNHFINITNNAKRLFINSTKLISKLIKKKKLNYK